MDYQAYKKEFLESLRNDSAINGTDTEDEFLNRTLSLLVDYDEVNDPVRFGMGDKRGRGNRLMRADGYCFDETDHSLILFISDFQDSENAANLTRSRVDELYWRLYYFLDEVCNGRMEDYFDDSDDILRVARMFRKRMTCNIDDPQLILKIKFYSHLFFSLSGSFQRRCIPRLQQRNRQGFGQPIQLAVAGRKSTYRDERYRKNAAPVFADGKCPDTSLPAPQEKF